MGRASRLVERTSLLETRGRKTALLVYFAPPLVAAKQTSSQYVKSLDSRVWAGTKQIYENNQIWIHNKKAFSRLAQIGFWVYAEDYEAQFAAVTTHFWPEKEKKTAL